ncbi:hypothetical protein NDU88_003900 [Pleurodeles waltl]|uniref:Uncharacterized protein n=1 Tax=Pleurodeles waltl TaxID=8319 RepID=A0AAV7KWV2_PLEWA|nr:hypothetical protein NDU88_003900 [Pleurodeles waltl]
MDRVYEGADDPCPHCQHLHTGFFHMVWQCLGILRNSEEVLEVIAKLTGKTILLEPTSCLLGLMPRPKVSKYLMEFFELALALAKQQTAISRKSPSVAEMSLEDMLTWARAEAEPLDALRRRQGGGQAIMMWNTFVALEAKSDMRPP